MYQKFVAQVYLETPVIFGSKGMVGDSLLAGVAFKEHRDPERAIAEVPIVSMDGVAHMSRALCYASNTRQEERITLTASIMRDLDHDPDMVDILKAMPSKTNRKTDQGPLSNIQSRYTLNYINHLYFLGYGDMTEVGRRLNAFPFLGAQVSKGFGQIIRSDIWAVESDNPFFGMVGMKHGRNVVLRPIPVRLRDRFPEQLDFQTGTETWHNPYSPRYKSAELELCMVPPFLNGESFAPDDIVTLCNLA